MRDTRIISEFWWRSLWSRVRKIPLVELLLFAGILLLFYINSQYVSYPDEFVNLMGGKAILEGKVPYKEFFDHHLPGAWYLSAFLLLFSFGSFVIFRYLWAVLVFAVLGALALWIRKHHRSFYPPYMVFFALYPLMGVYFWFHLFIADSLAVFFFSLVFWILLVQTLDKKVSFKAIVAATLLTFCMLFSSLTFLYVVIVLYLWQLYLVGKNFKNLVIFCLASIAPYAAYALYLLATGSWQDFYYYNVVYNTEQYISIPNYTKGRFFNPVKFGFTLIYNFYNSFMPTLTKIKYLDLYLPVDTLAALGSLLLLILLTSFNWVVGIFYFLILSFSAPRSNLEKLKETDYQMALYLVLGVISAILVLHLLRRLKTEDQLKRDLGRAASVLLSIFFIFTVLFLLQNTYNKWYLQYTQKLPHIYDHAPTAFFLNDILDKDDVYWVGPYEPHQEFFVKNGKLPGRFIHLLPQFRENEILKNSFIDQFEKNPPKVIIFIHEASIFQTPALEFGAFFLDWMKPRYTSIENIKGVELVRTPETFNLRTDVYLRNDVQDQLLQKMQSTGYISR